MSKKHKKLCKNLNYFEHFLIFMSDVSVCVSISAFVSLVDVAVGIASSVVEFKKCAITAIIKKYKSIIKKKRKKHDKIVLLTKKKKKKIQSKFWFRKP